jgi:hypothetical protein
MTLGFTLNKHDAFWLGWSCCWCWWLYQSSPVVHVFSPASFHMGEPWNHGLLSGHVLVKVHALK